jgi:hypothetical protein
MWFAPAGDGASQQGEEQAKGQGAGCIRNWNRIRVPAATAPASP